MSKVMSLSEAIDRFVHDGDVVYAAGFTHLIPFAAGHEIIRQFKKDLTLARATPDLIYDQLVAAGCAKKIIFSYSGNPGVGSLRIIRQEMEAGRLAYEEYSHFAMITRVAAGASGLPFLPMRPTGGEDLAKANPQYQKVQCPYTGVDLVTVPALNPDVAIIHAQRADAHGNTQIWGIVGEQKEVALASKKVIVTAEEIVDEAVIRSDPNRTLIPDFIVSAVCHVPHCAHPSYTQGYYDRDNKFYLEWDKISESRENVEAWLKEWVYGLKDHAAYWDQLGTEVHARLKVPPALSAPVNYGIYERLKGNLPMTNYSSSEMMIVAAARLLRDNDVVFVGIGQPNLACNLARRTHAPHLNMIYEAGVIGAQPSHLPLSIGDPCLVSGAASICSMYEIFAYYLQNGKIDVGFLGGAQIDRFGNINATVIGPYEKPKVRLPGSGGAAEIAAWANRIYCLTPHQARRFPEKCDFITSAGFLSGRKEREAKGLRGGGPQAVVTDLGMLEPDENGELILTALHASRGATVEQAIKNTGWKLKVADDLKTTEPPGDEELRLLREELDPTGIYLK